MESTYEVYENGVLVSSTVIEVPDLPPTPEEQLAELRATVDTLLALLEGWARGNRSNRTV